MAGDWRRVLPGRLGAVRWVLVLGLAVGMVISWKLWVTERAFPHLPVFEWLGPWAAPWDGVLLGVFGVALGLVLVRPRWVSPLVVVFVVAGLLALQDQVRWQPWFYLYLLCLAGFLFRPSEGKGEVAVLGLIRLLLVAMYFWSGFHKLHPAFDNMYGQAFVTPLEEVWPGWMWEMMKSSQDVVPWLEMLTAVCLLVSNRWVRHGAVVLAVLTHGFILVLVGPWGVDINQVIWPWNVAMILLVPLVFWGIGGFGWRELVGSPVRYLTAAMVVLVGVLPAFSPGGWDRYLSFHLYSARDHRVMFMLHESAAEVLPEEVRPYLRWVPERHFYEMNFKTWCLEECKVPCPAEERLNMRLGKIFAAYEYPPGTGIVYIDYTFEFDVRGAEVLTVEAMRELEEFPELKPKTGNQ